MAGFTINIPNDKVNNLLDAFNAVYPRAFGETKAENAKKNIREYVKAIYAQGQAKLNAPDPDITIS